MTEFKRDVEIGFSKSPKQLSSKYFYDKIGDDLFVQIMHSPEYYLTRSELEIFKNQTADIVKSLGIKKDVPFDLIELGPGDGLKTKHLLSFLLTNGHTFDYLPIDISQNALNGLETSLVKEMPNLSIKTKQGDYFDILTTLKSTTDLKVVLFLGSNIGNLSDVQANKFITGLSERLRLGDKLLIGVDLIKSAEIISPAYDDAKGLTSAFNLNLLSRINKELGANFELAKFKHSPKYSENEGIARSFIESTENQSVHIEALNKDFYFKKGEQIHTEISRKYNDKILNKILEQSTFKVKRKLTDQKGYFADYILEKHK